MSNPCSSTLELLGMIVGVWASFCSLAATLMPNWLSLSTELLTVESYEWGLWETCVVQEGAVTECRSYETLLGLSHSLTLARICMCMSDSIALLGLLIAIPGLKVVRSCGGSQGWRVKRGIKITAGVMGLTAGILGLFPVSNIAHDTVLKFHDHHVPHIVPRWEFGDALFVGWAAGCFHVVSAMLFFTSCCGSEENEKHFVYNHKEKLQPANISSKIRIEYV